MPVPPASSIVSTMSSTSRRTHGAVGSATSPARARRTGLPMRAIFNRAMVQNMRPGRAAEVKHAAPSRLHSRSQKMLNNAAGGRSHGVPRTVDYLRRMAPVQVLVRDNNVDQALRALKKKMQREGVFREMKLRRNYEKPSERRAREKAEAVRRYRKLLRKRMEREGY